MFAQNNLITTVSELLFYDTLLQVVVNLCVMFISGYVFVMLKYLCFILYVM